ncbi:MAG: hypothetical protein GY841_18245 [FCB group bacterium]|nr:hypothetical protein [FCB group bacterium]
MDYDNLTVGILTALIVQVVAIVIVRAIPPVRKAIGGLFRRLFSRTLVKVYANQAAAAKDIKRDFAASGEVRLFFMRGMKFSDHGGAFRECFEKHKGIVKVLMADPGDSSGDNPVVGDRGMELPAEDDLRYRDGLKLSVDGLLKLAAEPMNNIRTRLHREASCHRFFIFNDAAYLSFYEEGLSGAHLPVYRFDSSTTVYRGLSRYHEKVWKLKGFSRPLKELNYHPNPAEERVER